MIDSQHYFSTNCSNSLATICDSVGIVLDTISSPTTVSYSSFNTIPNATITQNWTVTDFVTGNIVATNTSANPTFNLSMVDTFIVCADFTINYLGGVATCTHCDTIYFNGTSWMYYNMYQPVLATWDCVNGACIDLGNGNGTYTDSLVCVSSCVIPSWVCVNGVCIDFGNGGGTFTDSLICVAVCVTPSWDCIANSCVDPGNGSGTYSTLSNCQSSCGSTAIEEVNSNKTILKIVDVLGRKVNPSAVIDKTTLFYIYDDGTVEKKIIIE